MSLWKYPVLGVCAIAWALCLTTASFGDPVEPIMKGRKLYLDTELAREGAACAVIYHPASPEYRAAAEELARQLKERYAVSLPFKADDEKRAWRGEKGNIIALGNMGNSPLVRWLYLRSFFEPPSDAKRRMQTVHDPWGEGRNVIVLGGVDVEGVKTNFSRLMELLKTPRPGTVLLPRTLDPQTPMTEAIKARIAEYTGDLKKLHVRYAAYHAGWVCDNYARLGHEELAVLYRDCIRRMADEKYYVHLYLFRECQAWEVIEHSPALTDADRLMIVNFFRDSVADPKEGIGYVRGSLRGKHLIQGNHPSQAACGVMVVADYLRKFYPSELHEKWYQEASSFFEPYRSKGSYTGDNEGMQGASIENIMNAVSRTEDDPAAHPYLRRTLDRIMPNYDNFGLWPAFGDQARPYRFNYSWFLTGAQLYARPEYLWMYHFIKTARPNAQGKVPAEPAASGWWPLTFAPSQPENFVGLQWAEPDETLFSLARPKWAKENNVTMADCFGKAAFRAGLSPQDDFALVDGVHLGHAYDDQNGFLEYSTLGRTFLVSMDCDYGTKPSAHNVVSVSVNGMADIAPSLLAARRLWADLPSFAATRTVLHTNGRSDWVEEYCPSADWERNILWLKNRFFVVFDRVIARQEGLHSAVAFWRMVGERHDLPEGIEMRQQAGKDDVTFRLTVQGADDLARGRENDPQATYIFYRYGPQQPPLDNVPQVIHMLKAHKAAPLKPGESFTISTCFWASSAQRQNDVDCKQVAPNAVRVELNQEPMLAARGPVSIGRLDVEAELSLIGAHRICLVSARRLAVGGRPVFEAQAPVSLEWDMTSGKCEVRAEAATQISLDGQALAAPAGRSQHQVKDSGASGALANALGALRAPQPAERPRMREAPGRLEVASRQQLESPAESVWVGQLGPAGETVVVGQRNGEVQAMAADTLKPVWTYRCGNVVNSIDAGDLMGDGKTEVVIGSDDYHVHALAADGTLLWKWKAPFDELKAKMAYNQWMWPEPFVKKVAVHDVSKDGKAEVVAGTGMNTFGVDGSGRQLWVFRDNKEHCPCMRAIVFADVNKDGADEIIGGASDMWYDSSMVTVTSKGEELKPFPSDGWCSGVRVAIAEDLLGKGGKSLVFGTRRGGVWCYPDILDTSKRWYRMLGDQVDFLATLRRAAGPRLIVAAGGDTKWVTAFDPSGRREWAVYFDAAVTAMTANAAKDKLYVGCEDGRVYELDADGRILRSVALDGTPALLAATAAGPIVVGTRRGSVCLLR